MGISGYFKWLTNQDHYPDIARYCVEYEPYYDDYGVYHSVDETQSNLNGTEFDNLYLDMNGIIHSAANSDNYFKPKNENEIIQSIFDCIDRLFSIVRPRNLLYMAIDGVAPIAKLNQQRSRRILEIEDTLDKAEEMQKVKSNILANGNFFPDDQHPKEQIEQFDKNCITPGTSFMTYLTDCLRYYIYYRMNTNPAWGSIKVILSGANVPGEGEHKIINYIRRQRAQPNYNIYTQHVIFGADADLILLGLATHENCVTIMRNEFKPRLCDVCQQFGHDFKKCQGIPKEKLGQLSNNVNHIKTYYIFVDLSILRHKLYEFLMINNQSLFQWDFERFLDDWIFICLLIGNDFLPDLPSFEISENSIDDLLMIYLQHVPEFNDYLTDNGQLKIELFKRILKVFGKNEDENFQKWHQKSQLWQNTNQASKIQTKPSLNLNEIKAQSKTPIPQQFKPPTFHRPAVKKPDEAKLSIHQPQVTNSSNSQDIEQTKQEITDLLASTKLGEDHDPNDHVRLWEKGWHERYYNNKFKVDKDHLNECRLQVVQHYIKGLCWVLQYYYHNVPSWDWYYPYHYAPFASDFEYLSDIFIEFNEHSKPSQPLEQLISLLPPQYAKHLPEKWQPLVLKPPISEFYPSSFSIDPNGKRYKSQYTVVLPFVDKQRLHEVLEDNYLSLTPEEKKRNEVENDLLFISPETPGYNYLKQKLEINNENKITYENSLELPTITGLPGYIWQVGNARVIEKSIRAPMPNYENISHNHIMCVKYR